MGTKRRTKSAGQIRAVDPIEGLVDEREAPPANEDSTPEEQTQPGDESYATADLRLVPVDPPGELSSIETTDPHLFSRHAGAVNSDSQIKAYAEDLKRVLATLSTDHSVRRATQRVVVAGVNSGFDASRIAWGLALTSAGSGFRVLLVDTNLNRPAAHAQFGVSNDFGLSDLLASSEPPHRFPQSTRIPNLAVIAAGPKLSIHASLLAREQLFRRLQPLASYFDYIIADAGTLTPALTARVSTGADNVILTVRQHVSSMQDLAGMVRTLRDVDAPEPSVLMIE